ncbi:LuxR C-terminal-related transcriptional regulator [Flavonifractor sp. AGMB03687]|uniref:helix-turn-helix transcriptional regulator n=1 Tax=Flavonifractor sp. AGMB03687 TaxID=2785133 RepID=UPI001ADF5DA9|nr:LuxR C-terminal-related transcriptional regulator [Flavonifractor sp. AGMB03687]
MAGGAKETGKTEMRDFKELSLEELRRGYVTQADGTHTCIFCGETFESGVIYHSHGRDVTAERAVREHMEDVHSGTFWPMIELEKTLNGLTDVQKTMLACLYEGKSTDEIGELMGISPATVRAHKFNLQKAKREAKILLALLELIEGDEPPIPRPAGGQGEKAPSQTDDLFSLNMLHPFFTQFRYK